MQSFRLTLLSFLCSLAIVGLQAQDILISGIVDGPLSGGTKAIELTVLNDIADLSQYGIGSANNGGGSDGEEFTFPAVAATAGDCILVTQSSDNFLAFFGFAADYESGAANINGNDAIELFFNGTVIDVFGEIMYTSGPDWDFVDGWVYRVDGTGPDGETYNPNNWTTSGPDALDGESTNNTAANPYPICTYEDVLSTTPEFNFAAVGTTVSEDVVSVDVEVTLSLDAECTVEVALLGSSTATEGDDFTFTSPEVLNFQASETLSQMINIPINDDMDTEGPETIVLGLQTVGGSGGCAIGNTDQFTINITDNEYNQVSIGSLAADDAQGVSLFIGDQVEITGTVYCSDFRGGAGYEFYIQDATGGMNIFSFSDVDNYQATEGDNITVRGEVLQFRGLTEVEPDEIILNSQGNAIIPPTDVEFPAEENESQLIRLTGYSLVDPAEWTTGSGGFGFEVNITDGTNNALMLIDADTDLFNATAPSGALNIVGVCNQRSGTSAPFLDGYRIIPCSTADFTPSVSINDPVLAQEVQLFPNPATDRIQLNTGTINFNEWRMVNVLGQTVKFNNINGTNFDIQVNDLQGGIYFLELTADQGTVVKEVVVQ
ncbi:MAG: T9SS type A sorting domain-containing protein [Bacteroidota bacterium]